MLMMQETLPNANTALKVTFCLNLRARFHTIGMGKHKMSRSPVLIST